MKDVDKRWAKVFKKSMKTFQNISNKYGCEIQFGINDRENMVTISKPEKRTTPKEQEK